MAHRFDPEDLKFLIGVWGFVIGVMGYVLILSRRVYNWAMDRQVEKLIGLEKKRQQETLQMIPSENYASSAVLSAQGSVLSNKYAEGIPGRDIIRAISWLMNWKDCVRTGLKNYLACLM